MIRKKLFFLLLSKFSLIKTKFTNVKIRHQNNVNKQIFQYKKKNYF